MEAKYKWGIGVGIVALILFLTRKKWMGSGKEGSGKEGSGIELTLKQDTVATLGGDAKWDDVIGQEYTLLSEYTAMNTKTFNDMPLKKGIVLMKKNDRNGTTMNGQSAFTVFIAPSGNDEYVIPQTLLKKSGGQPSQVGNKDAQMIAFLKDMESNPPKSKLLAEARLSEFGLTEFDLSAFLVKDASDFNNRQRSSNVKR